jgi:hypothetical protein
MRRTVIYSSIRGKPNSLPRGADAGLPSITSPCSLRCASFVGQASRLPATLTGKGCQGRPTAEARLYLPLPILGHLLSQRRRARNTAASKPCASLDCGALLPDQELSDYQPRAGELTGPDKRPTCVPASAPHHRITASQHRVTLQSASAYRVLPAS